MSVLNTDLEIFDNLMESVTKGVSKDHSRTMMESISIKNIRNVLDEAQIKRAKDFQKKKTSLINKKKIVIDAKKALKGLYESMLKDADYAVDTEGRQKFFEACLSINGVLTEMDSKTKVELDTLMDLTKKYDEAKIAPEEEAYIKSTDPELEITGEDDLKKKSMKPTVPATY